jgi:plasmid maintenance system antidote protein VapI
VKLADYLAELDISASECARRLGCAVPTITRHLSGERGVGLAVAVKIEEWSGGKVTPKELMREARANAQPSFTDRPFGTPPD